MELIQQLINKRSLNYRLAQQNNRRMSSYCGGCGRCCAKYFLALGITTNVLISLGTLVALYVLFNYTIAIANQVGEGHKGSNRHNFQ